MRVLDLYCGIGGLTAALEPAPGVEIVAAIDVNHLALDVYAHNFSHPTVPAVVESIAGQRWQRWNADLWWMSPPCQPFTRRGLGRDLDDARSATLVAVLERLAEIRPPYLAMENVPPFRGSQARELLLRTLEGAGYRAITETVLCPSELGVPNRRRRYYLVAAREHLLPLTPTAARPGAGRRGTLSNYLDSQPAPELDVEVEQAGRYRRALDVVSAGAAETVTSCFTSAYGRSPVRSGSYLRTPGGGLRYFSPAEILRLLGFPASFELPPGLSLQNAWRLVGNSLSLDAVRTVLATVPELAPSIIGRRAAPRSPRRRAHGTR